MQYHNHCGFEPLIKLIEKWKRTLCYLLSVWVLLSGTLLVAASTLASQSDMLCNANAIAKVSRSESTSRWVGSYDGNGNACGGNILTIKELSFSWGNCINVGTRSISISEEEFAFSVDRTANCGWAGWTISLSKNKVELQVVDVNAYKNLSAYQAKDYSLFCTFSKRLDH